MLYLGADHRGFKLKEKLKDFLKKEKIDFEDLGALSIDPEDDYPVIAEKVAQQVVAGENNLGVLICGSGHGVCIAANKVNGARAILADNLRSAKVARQDDDANILCLHGDNFDNWKAQEVVNTFIKTKFIAKDRYERRLEEITEIENRN